MNLAEFRRTLRLEGMEGVEVKWLNLLELTVIDTSLALDVIDLMIAEEEKKQASDFFEMLVSELLEREDYESALTVLKRQAQVFPTNKMLRERLIACYRALYAPEYDVDRIIDETGIRARRPVREALARMELFLSFRPGDPIQHRSWGLGIVKEVDIRSSDLIVDFLKKKGHRFDLELAASALMKVPHEGFKAKLVMDPDGLKKMAQEEPVEVIKLVLHDNPEGISTRDLRKHIEGYAIKSDDWTKWWGKIRKAVLSDPYIDATKGASPTLKLRTQAVGPAQEVLDTLQSGAALDKKIIDAHRSLALIHKPSEHADKLAEVVDYLSKMISEAADEAPLCFSLKLLSDRALEMCSSIGKQSPHVETPTDPEEVVLWIKGLPLKEHRLALLDACRPNAGERWPADLREIILNGTSDVRDTCVEELREIAPDQYEALIYELFTHSHLHFDAYADLARMILMDRLPCPEAYSLADTYRMLGTGANRLQSGVVHVAGDPEDVYKGVRTVLTDQKLVRRVLEETPQPEVARLLSLVQSLRRLDDRPHRTLEAVAHQTHPEVLVPEVDEYKIDERVTLTTEEGLASVRREFDNIMQEELPRIAEELGHAISLGDISDNAEYRSARQRQQDLVDRAKKMREQIARAKVVARGEVKTKRVHFGCKLTVTNLESGETETIRVLGPWEANTQEGTISYLSPLGRGFWGAREGEEIEIPLPGTTRRYRIEKIEVVSELQPDAE